MSKIKKNPLFIPLNFKLEIKKYMNGYIIWSSGFINCFKTKSYTGFNLKKNEHTLNLYSKSAYLNYYFLQNNNLKRKSTQKTSVLYWELKQNIISLLVGYKKILSAQGTEYEFKLEKNILLLETGYSHILSFLWNSSFQIKFSRKLKVILVQTQNIIKLMRFLSKIKRSQPMNIYTHKGIKYKKEMIRYKEGKKKKTL